MKTILRCAGIAALVLALGGCSAWNYLFSNKKNEEKEKAALGKRESILTATPRLDANAGVDGAWIKLPPPVSGVNWTQPGGNASNTSGHPALAAKPERAWRADIGKGSEGALRIIAQPVVANGRVFAMDARGRVVAFDAAKGNRLWRVDTNPKDIDDDAIGGGVAWADGRIFAATGYGEIVALDAGDGHEIWRRKLNAPLRSAPTIAGGRLYVVSIVNETAALDVQNGAVLWTQSGMQETASLLGAPSPAVSDDSVVATYSSGEIFALRVQNGRPAWGDLLSARSGSSSLPAMAAIRGQPVVDRGAVFVAGQNDRMAAIILRTGERAWEIDAGGVNTPLVAGNTVFVITNGPQLLALQRETGRIIWAQDLPHLTDPQDRDSDTIVWTGPILAGERLWAVNSDAKLVAFSPQDGKTVAEYKLPDPSMIAPVAAEGALYIVTEDGELVAFR